MVDLATAIAFFGPPLAFLGGAVGSTLGIAAAASAGLAVVSEDPAYRSRVLILSSLPMTQTFYGFIFMLVALMRLHTYVSFGKLDPIKALAILAISLAVCFAEMYSAITQGRVCRDAISLLIHTRGGIMGMGILLAAYEELFGILALAFGIMAMMMVLSW